MANSFFEGWYYNITRRNPRLHWYVHCHVFDWVHQDLPFQGMRLMWPTAIVNWGSPYLWIWSIQFGISVHIPCMYGYMYYYYIYIYYSMYHRVNVVKVLMLIRFFACGSFVLPPAGDAFSILAAHISREAWSLKVLVPQLGLSPVTQWVITQLLTSYYVGLSLTAYTAGCRQSNFRFRLSRSAEHGTKYTLEAFTQH